MRNEIEKTPKEQAQKMVNDLDKTIQRTAVKGGGIHEATFWNAQQIAVKVSQMILNEYARLETPEFTWFGVHLYDGESIELDPNLQREDAFERVAFWQNVIKEIDEL